MISIIIPIYNVSGYIKKCVNSVISQTYTDTEIILVDDGSPDDCPAISDEYAISDTRIITIHKPNGGLSSSRNKGIDIASGEYINFLDSDDYILPEMLGDMVDKLESNDSDMCISGYNRVDENDEVISTVSFCDTLLRRNEALEMLVQGNVYFIIACAKLYKKEIFNGTSFIEGKIHEDEFIAHRVFHSCKTILTLSQPYYQYLCRDNSITEFNKITIRKFHSVEAFIDRVVFFQNHNHCAFATRMLVRAIDDYVKQCTLINTTNENQAYLNDLRSQLISCIRNVNWKYVSLPRRIGFVNFVFGVRIYKYWMKLYKRTF